MGSFISFKLLSIVLGIVISCVEADTPFDEYYKPLWGFNHLTVSNGGQDVQLLLDTSSGAGFRSKSTYCFGSFQVRMKISNRKTGGVISSFFLSGSEDNSDNHDEFDFEFIGTKGILQTNVFTDDHGHREEKIQLWFDPSKDFHSYEIVWNQHQIVFNVDDQPIRVFQTSNEMVNFSSKPMHAEASIWNTDWAGVVDWSKAPFVVHYEGFNINANQTNSASQRCNYFSDSSMKTMQNLMFLNPTQQKQYEDIRRKYLRCSNVSKNHPKCPTKKGIAS